MGGETAPKLISTKSSLLPFDDEGWRGENVASIARAFLRVRVGCGERPGTGKGVGRRRGRRESGVEREEEEVKKGKGKGWLRY